MAGIALVERGRGRYARSEKMLRRIAAAYRRMGDSGGESFALWGLGGALRFRGRLRGALAAFMKSAEICRRLNIPDGLGYALCGAGGVTRLMGMHRKSEKNYRSAMKIFRKCRDGYGVAYSACGTANALRVNPRGGARGTNEAMRLYRRALSAYRKFADRSSEGFVEWGMAETCRLTGSTAQAARHLLRAMRLFKASGDRRGMALARQTGALIGGSRGAKRTILL